MTASSAQASERNSFSRRARSRPAASPPSWRHCCSPEEMIAKPALSTAFETAASCVTMSAQSRSSSSIRITPASWPWARRNRLTTGVNDAGSRCMPRSFGVEVLSTSVPSSASTAADDGSAARPPRADSAAQAGGLEALGAQLVRTGAGAHPALAHDDDLQVRLQAVGRARDPIERDVGGLRGVPGLPLRGFPNVDELGAIGEQLERAVRSDRMWQRAVLPFARGAEAESPVDRAEPHRRRDGQQDRDDRQDDAERGAEAGGDGFEQRGRGDDAAYDPVTLSNIGGHLRSPRVWQRDATIP